MNRLNRLISICLFTMLFCTIFLSGCGKDDTSDKTTFIVGFDADVEIGVGDYQGIITVPIESIVLEKTGTYVYLYNEEEGTVSKTLIETGAVSDSVYEVKSGLKTGDKIVATPSSEYEEDTFEVKVK